ncbi:hypothetical protein CHLRE_09g405600v5 [Chlamydomonas reinhardtii]|uniref:Uncharacterized protein n=1 Tax=Chlamydomonas reinhardtii TaxID=3055 RepID=A8J818_CHLRE|nr:uncharacterized protein CHLRE_09g405600v5 [Chlamydomonas reinhardtii]PNW79193.1 hypothetical protein CHLRE_09g405600v5 [Chlamydomonas reinhardtii]|eukprot:XP_001697670.1 Qc-SNARE protein, SFT1 family [Chlamydomonas reinhardtii]
MAGYPSRGGLSSRQQDQVTINVGKFDFDSEVEGLRGHVKKIKQLSLAIEDERKEQGEIINSLEDTMERAKLVMRRAMGRLNIAARQARSNHMLYLVLFAVAMFTVLYVLGKVYRIGRAVLGG